MKRIIALLLMMAMLVSIMPLSLAEGTADVLHEEHEGHAEQLLIYLVSTFHLTYNITYHILCHFFLFRLRANGETAGHGGFPPAVFSATEGLCHAVHCFT